MTPKPVWAQAEEQRKKHKAREEKSQFEKGLEFVKFGDFSRAMLLWWSPQAGYFTTDRNGRGLDGSYRVPDTTVELLAYASQ